MKTTSGTTTTTTTLSDGDLTVKAPTPLPGDIVRVPFVQRVEHMTLRQHFAGLAMQNLQNVLLRKSGTALLEKLRAERKIQNEHYIIAELAVAQADALIAALEGGE